MTTVAKNVIHTGITITKVELELELPSSFCPDFPAGPSFSPDLVVGSINSLDALTVSFPGRVVSEMGGVISGFVDTVVVACEVSDFVDTGVVACEISDFVDTGVVACEISDFVDTGVEAGKASVEERVDVEERVVFLTGIVIFNVVLSMCVVSVVDGDVFGGVVGSVVLGGVVGDLGKVFFVVVWEVNNVVNEDFDDVVEVVIFVVDVVDKVVAKIAVVDDVLAEVCDVCEVV